MWDLRKLQKFEDGPRRDAYVAPDVRSRYDLEFNFCQYLDETNYFARSLTAGIERLTNDNYKPNSFDPINDDEGKTVGLKVIYESDNICYKDNGDESIFSFTANIMCDESIDGQGEAELVSYNMDEHCAPSVTMKHKGGCFIYTASWWQRFLSKHPYVLGVLMIIGGGVFAVMGKPWFPWIAATIAALFGIFSVIFLFAEAGTLENWW